MYLDCGCVLSTEAGNTYRRMCSRVPGTEDYNCTLRFDPSVEVDCGCNPQCEEDLYPGTMTVTR